MSKNLFVKESKKPFHIPILSRLKKGCNQNRGEP
jgi:hypothetical protein